MVRVAIGTRASGPVDFDTPRLGVGGGRDNEDRDSHNAHADVRPQHFDAARLAVHAERTRSFSHEVIDAVIRGLGAWLG